MGGGEEGVSYAQVVAELCRETAYKIIDFYHRSYLEGGPTLQQVIALYEEIQEIKNREYKFQAAIHGAEFKKSSNSSHAVPDPNVPVFKSPKEYEKMTPEQREKETQVLMAHCSKFVEKGLLAGLKKR